MTNEELAKIIKQLDGLADKGEDICIEIAQVRCLLVLLKELAIYRLNEPKKGKWIPVSERMPDDRDWYLGVFIEPDTGFIGLPYICDYVGKVTNVTTKEGWILRGFTDIDNANDYTKSLECVAWQPLPKPYEEEDNEQ